MDRPLNYLFSFLLVVVFTFGADGAQHRAIILGVILASVCSFLAFLLRRLTLDGMYAAIVTGTFVFGLGGFAASVVVLLFFISSAAFSTRPEGKSFPYGEARRDGRQVWANGFWLVVCLTLASFFDNLLFFTAAMAAVAAAAADTWATEWGMEANGSTRLITSLEPVEPGTDGGISLKGSVMGLSGSLIIALASLAVFPFQFFDFICIFLAGLSASFIDSWLGAAFQKKGKVLRVPGFQDKMRVSNNLVNAVSTGSASFLAILLKLIFV